MLPRFPGADEVLRRPRSHDHICLVYESPEEQRAAVSSVIRMSLQRGERCLYLQSSHSTERFREYLAQEGLGVSWAENSGQLIFMPAATAYAPQYSFEPDHLTAFLIHQIEAALREGYPALCVLVEMDWSAQSLDHGSEKLLEYEARLNQDLVPQYPCLVVCQYDRRKFAPETMKGVIMTHPLIALGSHLGRNTYYIPPDEFLDPKRAEREVERWLQNIKLGYLSQERVRFFADLLEHSSQPFAVGYPDGKILVCNRAFCELTGYSEQELRTMSWRELTPPEWQEARRKAMEELNRTGQPQRYEKEYLRKDGSRVPVEMFVHQVYYPEEDITYRYTFATDISERKRSEQRLLSYQKKLRSLVARLSLAEEKQRRHIATGLHDSIGQTLALCEIKLDSLRETAASGGLGKSLDEIYQLVEQSLQQARSLSFELSPPILYEVGLEAAVEWLAEQIDGHRGIACTFNDDDRRKPLDDDIRVLLFQAVRELLVNISKHGQAQNIQISVQREGDDIRLRVEDDGIGFDTSKIWGRSTASGFGLFSIRERLRHVRGRLYIDSKPGHGTRVTLQAPLKQGKKVVREKLK